MDNPDSQNRIRTSGVSPLTSRSLGPGF